MVNSTRTKIKANAASQILTYLHDDEHFTNPKRHPWLREQPTLASWSGPFWWLSHVKRGLKDDFVHLCGLLSRKGRLRKGKRGNLSVQPPGKDFGNGRFNSSSNVSLPWHSSPLNKIDYWFLLSSPALLSIRFYFQSREQRKKKAWPAASTQNCIMYCTQMEGRWGARPSSWPCHSSQKGVMQKSTSSCGILIRVLAGLCGNACAVFLHRSCVSEKRQACLIIDRGEKLPAHHQTWILSDDIASPGAGHVTDSLMSSHPGVFHTIGVFKQNEFQFKMHSQKVLPYISTPKHPW